MLNPPPKPKNYSQTDMELATVKLQNEYLKENLDDLTDTVNRLQDNIKQLSNLVTSLAEKVAVLNDIFYKGLGALFLMILGTIIAWYFKK